MNVNVDVCFFNLGIFEMYMVVVIDKVEGMCLVFCFFEGVVLGVFDGYVCMIGWFVCIFLYLGLGMGNVIVNLYNV